MTFLFWLSATCLTYTFFGYPALIRLLARFRPKLQSISRPPEHPLQTSVVLVVFNAQGQIRPRLENLISQDYPIHEIVVVCDGCTDGTTEEVCSFSDPRIRLISRGSRTGKSACLNHGIQQATGEVVILADVRQQFGPETVSRLVGNFSDPLIGAVSGSLEIKPSRDAIGKGVDAYWSFEKKLRHSEATLDSCIGCTGAVYAIRRSLFLPFPSNTLLDDVVIPMQIALAGYRIAFEPMAIAYDPQSLDPEKESARKRRTLAGNFQMLFRYPEWFLPWRNRLWLQLISHKYLRLFAPLFLITLLGANGFLTGQTFYRILLILQTSFYLFGILGRISIFRRFRLFFLPSSFLFLNLMVLHGLIYYLIGSGDGIWENALDQGRTKDT